MAKEQNNRKRVWLRHAAILGLGLVLLLLLIPSLAVPVRDSTAGRMGPLFDAIEMYYYLYGDYPEGTMEEVLSRLQRPPRAGGNPDGKPLLDSLRRKRRIGCWFILAPETDSGGNVLDEWGRPIELTIEPKSRTIRMASVGRNGRDEDGGGDDFVMEDRYPVQTKEDVPHPLDFRLRDGPQVIPRKWKP